MADAVLFRNGIGNFILATPMIRQLVEPTIFIPDDDKRLPHIASISPWPVTGHNSATDLSRFDRVFRLWGAAWAPAGAIHQHDPNWANGLHETNSCLAVVPGLRWLPPTIKTQPSWKLNVGSDERIVALVNGGDLGFGQLKKWSISRWSELARVLSIDRRLQMVAVGGPEEASTWEAVANAVGRNKLWNFAGKTATVGEAAGLIDQCHAVVTTDTALMHVAAALGKPIIALWGGTILTKNKPLADNVVIVSAKTGSCPNAPCWFKPPMRSCKVATCMDAIQPLDVAEATMRQIGR